MHEPVAACCRHTAEGGLKSIVVLEQPDMTMPILGACSNSYQNAIRVFLALQQMTCPIRKALREIVVRMRRRTNLRSIEDEECCGRILGGITGILSDSVAPHIASHCIPRSLRYGLVPSCRKCGLTDNCGRAAQHQHDSDLFHSMAHHRLGD